MRKWSRTAMSVTAMAMVVCVAPATAASAEDTTLADEAASVEAVDVTDPSQRLPIDAEMRAAIVGALKADLAAPSRTAGQRNQTLRELAQL